MKSVATRRMLLSSLHLEDSKEPPARYPFIVRPATYKIPHGLDNWGYWCKLGAVMRCAKTIMASYDQKFNPTAKEFIAAYVAVTRPNQWRPGIRVFRYCSSDGLTMFGTRVRVKAIQKGQIVNFLKFKLDVPCTADMFVTGDWAIATLDMVLKGVTRVNLTANNDGVEEYGWCETIQGNATFTLDGKITSATEEYWAWSGHRS